MKHFLWALVITALAAMGSSSCKSGQSSGGNTTTTTEPRHPKDPLPPISNSDSFSLSKTGCLGRCPVFQCYFSPDGNARYKGKQFVKWVGDFSAPIPLDTLIQLVKTFQSIRFDTLQTDYFSNLRDLPSVILSYKGKTVRGHSRALPSAVNALIARIDTVIAQTKWNSLIKE